MADFGTRGVGGVMAAWGAFAIAFAARRWTLGGRSPLDKLGTT